MTVLHAAADLAHRGTAWLATQPGDYDPSTGKGPDWGKAAPIGLLIILLLGAALFFLIKSMNKNLRRVPASFDPPAEQPGDPTGRTVGDTTVASDAARTVDPSGPVVPAPDETRPPR